MFLRLVRRNSKRSRRENGLFFASLLVSIIAFYIILSLSHQDVMLFLQKMESDAVSRLMKMIPLFYGVTLFLLFFLIYYAGKFQMERRRHEFGVYLIMGMRRFRLLVMLLAEDFHGSILALVIGLPAAVLLSELVSLITARFVGLGIVGHRFTFSTEAVFWTVAGFLLIKFLAFLLLSARIAGREIGALLAQGAEREYRRHPALVYACALIPGIFCLGMAYTMGIRGVSWERPEDMGITVITGLLGMFLFFFGLRGVMGFLACHGTKGHIRVFCFRQLQEIVIRRSGMLAVSCALMLSAPCCFGAGVGIAGFYAGEEQHVLDYTFWGDEQKADEMLEILEEEGLSTSFSELFEIRTGHIRTEEDEEAYRMEAVMEALGELPESEEREILLNNLSYVINPGLISLSGYNRLLTIAGCEPLALQENEAAVYMEHESAMGGRAELMDRVLEEEPEVWIKGKLVRLKGKVQTAGLITDRAVRYSFALILPDDRFDYYTQGMYSSYLNGVLSREMVEDKGLMQAILEINGKMEGTEQIWQSESYLGNMGRKLFFMVAASYITIYLSLIFFVIANTAIGVQFLMAQQKSARRYRTLAYLGAGYEQLCHSAAKQIHWYFGIPVIVAAISSFFGVRALFTGLLPSRTREGVGEMMWVSAAMILLLLVVEWIYITAVKRISSRYLLTLMTPKREE